MLTFAHEQINDDAVVVVVVVALTIEMVIDAACCSPLPPFARITNYPAGKRSKRVTRLGSTRLRTLTIVGDVIKLLHLEIHVSRRVEF